MGAFATQFEVALKEMGFRQVEISRRAGGVISATQVSRYLSGHVLPELKSLEAMIGIFPEHIRQRLVTAYLLDHVPASASHLVSVQPLTDTGSSSPVYGRAVQGSELAKCLTFLEERALQNPQVADMVIAIVRALHGDPITSSFDINDADAEQPDLGLVRDLPLFGTVPAGFPSDNPQEVENFIPVPVNKYPDDAFALRVRGDSMIGREINDGDIVVVQKREAKNGDVVVALIAGETTLKTLVYHKGKWKLRSENPKHKDPLFSDQSVIQAVFIEKLNQAA